MCSYKNLKPYVHTIKIVGATGAGKTHFTTLFTEGNARSILSKCIGLTNSTLKERLLVFSTAWTDRIIVATKLNETPIERSFFSDIIADAWSKVIQQNIEKSNNKITLKKCILDEMNNKSNTRAIFSFLSIEEKESISSKIIKFFEENNLEMKNNEIYEKSKNTYSKSDSKMKTDKFLNCIKHEVFEVINCMEQEKQNILWNIWDQANDMLKSVFYAFFNKDDVTCDGYYFRDINLGNNEYQSTTDKDFIQAMFTSNDINSNGKLSLEVLCDEIVIYFPMSSIISNFLQEDVLSRNLFTDNDGNLSFGIIDTRGLYHSEDTKSGNIDYLGDLLYQTEVDALFIVVPLAGDTNEKKNMELYKDIFKNFYKQIPVFLIHTKLDTYINLLKISSMEYDPLSQEVLSNQNPLSVYDFVNQIHAKENEIVAEFKENQSENLRDMMIKSFSFCLVNPLEYKDIVDHFNPVASLKAIFKNIAQYLDETFDKIPFILSQSSSIGVFAKLNKQELSDLTIQHIDYWNLGQHFDAGISNIKSNLGKTPHGNSYYALKERLKFGNGYDSDIKTDWFINCHSFDIFFPECISNFIYKQWLQEIIPKVLTLHGGSFNSLEDEEKFLEIIIGNINPRRLGGILFYNALLKAESSAFGFKGWFQNFLIISLTYFEMDKMDNKAYISAMETILMDAVERAIKMNLTLR